jgi:hypothetical protein
VITLQNLLFPERDICTEFDLYFHLNDGAAVSLSEPALHLAPGGKARLGTYFNTFSLGKWHEAGALDGLFFALTGTGKVEVKLFLAIPDRSWEILYCEILTLDPDQESLADLSHYAALSERGVIFAEVKAAEAAATVTGGGFKTNKQPKHLPRLAVSITTFKREEAVRETVARLDAFIKSSPFGAGIHAFVVDNGASADIAATSNITPITNKNLGGAGGFARGLLEATQAGFTHCLFMDDDAAFHMENLHRTYAFLALTEYPDTAIAGAMINNTHKWAMWENGAWFEKSCHPLFCGADLRRLEEVVGMELATTGPAHRKAYPTLYGGWWFFAFRIDQAKHHPFPFFVRGDDISFSLANGFRITTLNGVVSFQDDFSEKESPQTLYLDLRSHLLHHLIFDTLDLGRVGTAKVALRFIMRSVVRFHYETAEAQLLSWQDVMRGPEFFASNADMAERRGRIKAMTNVETWRPADDFDLTERRRYTLRRGRGWMRFFVYSLNGHLLPFWNRRADRIVVGMGERGTLHPTWGAQQITYLNATRDKAYMVKQSKRRFFGFAWRLMGTTRRFLRDYKELKAAYRTQYPQMTSKSFWEKTLYAEPTDKAA